MKRFLAIAIAIAVLLAPIYSINAAGFAVEGSWTQTTTGKDTVTQIESGLRISRQGGMFANTQGARVAWDAFVDPTNFQVGFIIDSMGPISANSPYGNQDGWVMFTLLDNERSFITFDTATNGIAIMFSPRGDGTAWPHAFTYVDGNPFVFNYGGNYIGIDALNVPIDMRMVRGADGKYNITCNDFTLRIDFDSTSMDRAFYQGAWESFPVYNPTDGSVSYKQFAYPAVAATAEVKEAGKLYQPAVTAFAATNGPELEFIAPRAAVAQVTAVAAYWTQVVHPAVTATAEVAEAGKTYVPAVTSYAGTIGPEWKEIPAVVAVPGATAIANTLVTVKYVTTVNAAGATTYRPANMIYTTPVYKFKLDSAGKKMLKPIYFKINQENSRAGESSVIITSVMGKSLFKDMTPPIISGAATGGYYNNPTITVEEQGEGVVGAIKTNTDPNLTKGNEGAGGTMRDMENGEMLTTEGPSWVGAGSDAGWSNIYFVVDSTNPTLNVTAGGVAVADKSTVTGPVKIVVTDANLLSYKLTSPSGLTIRWPANGTFSAKSTYRLVAADKAGNVSSLVFTIK